MSTLKIRERPNTMSKKYEYESYSKLVFLLCVFSSNETFKQPTGYYSSCVTQEKKIIKWYRNSIGNIGVKSVKKFSRLLLLWVWRKYTWTLYTPVFLRYHVSRRGMHSSSLLKIYSFMEIQVGFHFYCIVT